METTITKNTYTVRTVGNIQDYISLYDNFTNSPATPSKKPLNEYLKTSSFIFIFIKNGKIVVDLNGTDYTIEKGHTITMTRNVVYNVKTVSEDFQYCCLPQSAQQFRGSPAAVRFPHEQQFS